jgi:prophage tail gpP-like protein
MRSDTTNVESEYTLNEWYDIDIDGDGTLHTNGIIVACPYEAPLDGTATNLYLFERRNWTQRYIGSVSEFWIKNNGVYKMYLIPCRRKSD